MFETIKAYLLKVEPTILVHVRNAITPVVVEKEGFFERLFEGTSLIIIIIIAISVISIFFMKNNSKW